MAEAVVDMREAMSKRTLIVTIKRAGELRWRWKVARALLYFGVWVMRLGAWVAWMGFEVEEIDEVKQDAVSE